MFGKSFEFDQTQSDLFFVHNKPLNCLNAFRCEYGEFEIIKDQKIKYNGKYHEVKENINVFIPKGKLTLVTPNILIACRSGITRMQREKIDESECDFNTTVFKVNLSLFELKPKTVGTKPEILVNEGRIELNRNFFERSLQKMYITNNICGKENKLTLSSKEFNKFFDKALGFLICQNYKYEELMENPIQNESKGELLFVVGDKQIDVNANLDNTHIDPLETQSSDLCKELEDAMMNLDD